MPTYQYVCTNRDEPHDFERVQSFTDPAVSECPTCGASVRKRYGSVGVVFKGSGFYRTDSRDGGKGDGAKSDAAKSDGAKSEGAKSDAKSDGAKSAGAASTAGSSNGSSAGSSSSSSSSGSSSSSSGSSPKTAAGASS